MTEDEMVGWHHRLDAYEFGWTLGKGEGQGGLVCCSSWGRKESDKTEWLNWTELALINYQCPQENLCSISSINRNQRAREKLVQQFLLLCLPECKICFISLVWTWLDSTKPCPWGNPRWAGHGGEIWQNVVHWRREWQTTSVFLPWEPYKQYEKAKW